MGTRGTDQNAIDGDIFFSPTVDKRTDDAAIVGRRVGLVVCPASDAGPNVEEAAHKTH